MLWTKPSRASIAAALVLLYKQTIDAIFWLWTHLSAGSVGKAAAALALLWLLGWAFRARRRIFVASFDDYTGDPSLKEFVSGLPRLLLNELGLIRQLHEDVNEAGAAGAASSGEGAIQATIRVQDVGETLQKAVTSESKVKLWGIEIPVGAVLGALGRITQGPQLSGSAYKQDGTITLIARLEGAGYPSTDWRVVSSDVGKDLADDNPAHFHQLVEQLAYRIFTDLVPTGARRWQAVYQFSRGLDCLRITTRTESDKYWNLRRAEAHFIEAVSEDNKFSTCYYNLGVVYTRLGQSDSASAAYSKAIEQDARFAPACYALALNRWNEANKAEQAKNTEERHGLYADCLRYCDRAIALDRNYARAWNLRGLAFRKIWGDGRDELKKSVRSRELAAAVAWRDYCRSRRKPAPDPSAIEIPFNCLRNLAVAHGMLKTGKARAIFRQALFLKPVDADLHYEFGRALDGWRRYAEAARQFQAAAGIDDKPLYWAWLAKAQASAGEDSSLIEKSLWRALQSPQIDDAIRALVKEASGVRPELIQFVQQANAARAIASEIDLRDGEEKDLKQYLSRLENLLPKSGRNKWHLGVVIEALQNRLPDPASQEMIGSIARRFVREKGTYGSVAIAFRDRDGAGDRIAALFHAEYAVTLNPLGYWERSVLGDIYLALGDYQRAEIEYNACLDFSPTESNTLSGIANTYWNRGVDVFNPDQRKKMFNRVIDSYGRVLRITENQILARQAQDIGESQLIDRGKAHFWLGRFHTELLNFDSAISELRKAKGLGFKPFESTLHLGSAYFEAKAYDRAEETLRSGLFDLIKTLRALNSAQRASKPIEKPAPKPGEDMQISELLAWSYLLCALAGTERRGDLTRAARLADKGLNLLKSIEPSKRRPPEALYHEVRGLLANKAGKVDDAIQCFERSVALAFESRCYLRLAEAHLTQAQTDNDQWKREMKAAHDCCDLAADADLRRVCGVEITALRARIDEFELTKTTAKAATP